MGSSARRTRLPLPLLAGAALALSVAACGESKDKPDPLTKAQVISRGGVICKAAQAKVEKLPQLETDHPFGKGSTAAEHRQARAFLTGYAAALDSSRHGLLGLKAPAEDKALLDDYLRDTGVVVAKLRAASRAPGTKVEAMANVAFAQFDEASRKTRAYGFPKDVCGAG